MRVELGDIGAARSSTGRQPALEAQLANVADEIAYNNHDIDDGLRSGLISLEQIESTMLFRRRAQAVRAAWPATRRAPTRLRDHPRHDR
jgi:dGTPase